MKEIFRHGVLEVPPQVQRACRSIERQDGGKEAAHLVRAGGGLCFRQGTPPLPIIFQQAKLETCGMEGGVERLQEEMIWG